MSNVISANVTGMDVTPVTVECKIHKGLPNTTILGNVRGGDEVAYIVRDAILSAGYEYPRNRIVVDCTPHEISKGGNQLSLAIACAILIESGQVASFDHLAYGDLDLGGCVHDTRGQVAVEKHVIDNGMTMLQVDNLGELRDPRAIDSIHILPELPRGDFGRDVNVPASLVRAVEVAVAGRHPLLMVGTNDYIIEHAARLAPTIVPLPTNKQTWDIAKAYSSVGLSTIPAVPFRAPHYRCTMAGMIGGGRPVVPGEVTLANHGILFLSDVSEFTPRVLDAIRHAREDGSVRIVRTDGSYVMPSDFILMASANPCMCGGFGDPNKTCMCSPMQIMRYHQRVADPKLYEMKVEVASGPYNTKTSDELLDEVETARWRLKTPPVLSTGALRMLNHVHQNLGLPLHPTTEVAQTISALSDCAEVLEEHVAEAAGYRL